MNDADELRMRRADEVLALAPVIPVITIDALDDALPMARALVDNGLKVLEVTLRTPAALDAIERIAGELPGACVGAGTVLDVQQVREVHAAGGQLVVSPDCKPAVIAESVKLGMVSLPGVMTPTEAFAALDAGATGLKLFPAELASPAVVKALLAVLPAGTPLMPVGGISPDNMDAWRAAGATGFGIGSALYKPGKSAAAVADDAQKFVAAWQRLVRA